MRSALLHYINNGLAHDINNMNMDCYQHMRLVDYVDGKVWMLIGGKDPQTHSTISRDVLIDGYMRVYVRPLIVSKFQDVHSVIYIPVTNIGFDDIVEKLGGTVSQSNYSEKGHSFRDCMKLFGDSSPFVQGFMKGTFLKHNNKPSSSNQLMDKYSTMHFFQRWDLGWFLTDETHVLATNGKVLWGSQQIRDNRHLLPQHLVLQETEDGVHKWILLAKTAHLFQDAHFKIIDF